MALQDDEDTVMSLGDVLEEDKELEETANAVLGDSEDSECSYKKGYVGRQALYSCATCSGKSDVEAGLCLACSLHCHEGHELYELYTKRQFRCDCGNSKFPDFTCSLQPDKASLNEGNQYGQNFRGLYCICNRPYPDPEDKIPDEMVQCIVCEDWFHSRHLNAEIPSDYEEMSCERCTKSHDFLQYYKLRSVPVIVERESKIEATATNLDVVGKDKEEEGHQLVSCPPTASAQEKDAKPSSSAPLLADLVEKNLSGHGASPSCELKKRQNVLASMANKSQEIGAGFFPVKWRKLLCRCLECMVLYKSSSCEFLLNDEDSLTAYEQRAQPRLPSHDAAVEALTSSMGRVEQVEAIQSYNELKSELVSYFKDFADSKKVVSKRDIDHFFDGMQERKRQRRDNEDGVPPSVCRF